MPGAPDPDPAAGAAAPVPPGRARALLRDGELEVVGRIPWASNATLLARASHEDLECLAIYKPAAGERPLWDFPEGTLHLRELAAYLVSERLAWDLVPLTVVRDGPFGVGSVQLFVDADPQLTAFELVERGDAAMPLIAVFDVVVNNADRKAGHCLAAPDGHVWAIDHGVCFHAEPKLRTVLWDFAGQRLGAPVVATLEELAAALRGDFRARLDGVLAPGEIAAMAARATALARRGRLPHPQGRHPYPWPLV